MEKQYGPSTLRKKSMLKHNRMKQLFGSDSENEEIDRQKETNIQKLHEQLYKELDNLTESDCDDVLEITIDNDNFGTPNKVTHVTEKPLSIADESSLPTHTQKTPSKQTASAESLTPKVKRILKQTIQPVQLLSPIQKTPTRNVHLHDGTLAVTITQTYAQAKNKHLAHSHKQTAHKNKRIQPYSLTQNTHKSKQTQSVASHSHTLARNAFNQTAFTPHSLAFNTFTHTHASFNSHTLAPSTQAFTHIQASNSSSHALASITRTLTQIQSSHSHTNNTNARNSNTTQVRPNTHTERQTTVDELQSLNEKIKTQRIIKTNNKYVPKGEQLSILIDKKKYLSKNQLKKITRNLLSQL